jgi:TRAP-type C4-dicarboxylate transport system substrate-binding protein
MNRHGCVTAVAALALVAGLAAAPAVAAEYRMLTSWDKTNPAVGLLAEGFARDVDAASKGAIKIVLNGPETVSPFEQLQPVAAGAFQMLFTHGIYHYGTTGIGTGLDAVRGTIEERRASGLFEALDKDYQRQGLKVIAVAISAKTGYAFALKAPVSAEGDLRGRKIRGTPAYHPLIRMLNGAPVVLPIPEVYTAMEKGVIDGAASPVVGFLGVRWYEVAKYLTQPSFGVSHQMMLMNLAAWNRLSDADKKIMLDAGRKMEDVWYREYDRLAETEVKELVAKGVTLTNFGPSQAKLNEVWSEGLWELAEKKSPAEAKALRQIAKSKGITD